MASGLDPKIMSHTFEQGEERLPPRYEVLRQMGLVEALIFASREPLSESTIAQRLPQGSDIRRLLTELQANYSSRGVNLVQIGDAWTFRAAERLFPSAAPQMADPAVDRKEFTSTTPSATAHGKGGASSEPGSSESGKEAVGHPSPRRPAPAPVHSQLQALRAAHGGDASARAGAIPQPVVIQQEGPTQRAEANSPKAEDLHVEMTRFPNGKVEVEQQRVEVPVRTQEIFAPWNERRENERRENERRENERRERENLEKTGIQPDRRVQGGLHETSAKPTTPKPLKMPDMPGYREADVPAAAGSTLEALRRSLNWSRPAARKPIEVPRIEMPGSLDELETFLDEQEQRLETIPVAQHSSLERNPRATSPQRQVFSESIVEPEADPYAPAQSNEAQTQALSEDAAQQSAAIARTFDELSAKLDLAHQARSSEEQPAFDADNPDGIFDYSQMPPMPERPASARKGNKGRKAVFALAALALLGGGGVYLYNTIGGGGPSPNVLQAAATDTGDEDRKNDSPDTAAAEGEAVPTEETNSTARNVAYAASVQAQLEKESAAKKAAEELAKQPDGTTCDMGTTVVTKSEDRALATANDITTSIAPNSCPIQTYVVKSDGTIVNLSLTDFKKLAAASAYGLETPAAALLPPEKDAQKPPAKRLLRIDEDTPVDGEPENTSSIPAVEEKAEEKPKAQPEKPSRPKVVKRKAEPRKKVQRKARKEVLPRVASPFAVQISSQPSYDAAQKTYANLSRRYGSLIVGQGVDIRKARVNGKQFYRIRIPAWSRDEATSLCDTLKASGGDCFVTK